MFQVSRARPVSRTDNLTTPCMSRLSRQCRILNISQPYWPPRLVKGTALLYLLNFILGPDFDVTAERSACECWYGYQPSICCSNWENHGKAQAVPRANRFLANSLGLPTRTQALVPACALLTYSFLSMKQAASSSSVVALLSLQLEHAYSAVA
jgi:hypothetical protein